jgi:hypothetical protein
MTDFTQIPGLLNITTARSDDFLFFLEFNIDLTGYSFSSKIITAVTNTPISMTVADVDLSEGQISIALDATKISKLALMVHHWYLDWSVSGTTRRVLAGTFTVIDYS